MPKKVRELKQMLRKAGLIASLEVKSFLRDKKMETIKYRMVIQWSDEDDCFLVALPDFPGQCWRTHGDTYEEAFMNGKEAIESLIIAYEVDNEPLPKPLFCRMG